MKITDVKITDRDHRLFRRINAYGFMTIEQIADWMEVDFSTAARRVRKLIAIGLVAKLNIANFTVTPVVVTKAACRLVSCGIPTVYRIRPATFRHDSLLADLGLALERRYQCRFESERELKWRPHAVTGHLPDGILHRADGMRVAIELELSQKSRNRIDTIMSIHAANVEIDEVWYVVIDEDMRVYLKQPAQAHPHIKIVTWTPPSRRSPTASTRTDSGV